MSDYRLSARAIIIRGDEILLNEFGQGLYYNLIGGGVEVDEDLRSAVEREVLEESGYTAKSKGLLYIYEYNPKRDGFRYGKRGALSHVFICEIDESIPREKPCELDQNPDDPTIVSSGGTWVKISDLTSINLVPKIGHIIKKDIEARDFTTKFLEGIE